ncbi:hypothetical protein EV102420_08_03070 [Pseudescherichia vulneris NBRC 102420]|uniref:Uncharacterized protein n=1 Tax=Pseudescherichia vulneris NBRC 102420 TaxID=1115515 RepID=A0A090V3J9_PSEVU|nr:hypothetical protein [Pseudescherichia vulneris]GAL57844.1 hypothetical protein EV102420_08_03070 [Pseudescherichia vulneris NBRC 102420]STQ58393.1 Uncharacterised protein [Pseudescherichia vulneris]
MNKLRFMNAQRMARLHPETFLVYDYDELSLLKPGHLVKVCSNRERFWVVITNVEGKRFTGTVANNLVFNDIAYGETVQFTMTNIFDYQM